MSHLDRYVFKQCPMVFTFFTLVFALVIWINQADTLFDELVTDGHSAKVFFEFAVLALPTVLSMVLPLSAFAATVYVTSRLRNESELAVIQATGMSPWRLARLACMFGLLITTRMFGLIAYLVLKRAQLSRIRNLNCHKALAQSVCAKDRFNTPSKAIRFFPRNHASKRIQRCLSIW
jgi:lipopolysaccharide export system permease protein